MNVVVNGESRELAGGATLSDLMSALSTDPRRGLAAAVNGEVVPRAEWGATELSEADRVEVVQAVAGG